MNTSGFAAVCRLRPPRFRVSTRRKMASLRVCVQRRRKKHGTHSVLPDTIHQLNRPSALCRRLNVNRPWQSLLVMTNRLASGSLFLTEEDPSPHGPKTI